jgi:aspartyl-tRNA(Asn)/glutamyl-tRNA(Gln) amidotransferase subunit B
MEQDTAKTLQQPPSGYLLDFNRVSHPLIEIISLPHIHHPSTAAAFVRKIQSILRTVDAATAGMEVGGLRADVNVSVRRRHVDGDSKSNNSYYGVTGLGQRTEIKNLSSLKAVEDAIIAERDRQIGVLESGGVINGETRGWTLGSTETRRLRGKEGEIDYRYMPDPDLPPVFISSALVENLKTSLPLLPDGIMDRLTDVRQYGLTIKDAKTLLAFDDAERLEYYFGVVHQLRSLQPDVQIPADIGRITGNWVLHDLGSLFAKFEVPWSSERISSSKLTSIISLLVQKKIAGNSARQLLQTVFEGDAREVSVIVEEEDMLIKELSDDAYHAIAQRIIDANPEMASAVKDKGQKGKAMWFVGRMMREMAQEGGHGGVRADKVREAVFRVLEIDEDMGKEKKK